MAFRKLRPPSRRLPRVLAYYLVASEADPPIVENIMAARGKLRKREEISADFEGWSCVNPILG